MLRIIKPGLFDSLQQHPIAVPVPEIQTGSHNAQDGRHDQTTHRKAAGYDTA